MNKFVETKDLFECKTTYLIDLFINSKYPWDMLTQIGQLIFSIIKSGVSDYELLENNVLISKNVKIYHNTNIEGPAIIGSGTEIRPGAFIRGNVIIGENCVIGNSTEVKNSILLNDVQIPHYNYVGDSILGNKVHMGAGSICSNLKADGKSVVIHGDDEYKTDLRKIGAFLADGVDVGCGCVLNPGTIIGKSTSVYPLTSLRGVYPGNSIIKDKNSIVPKI